MIHLPVVQSLWVGDRLGPLQQISLASFLRVGHAFHLYCYESVRGVPAGVVIRDAREILGEEAIFRQMNGPGRGSLAPFADLFRYKLLLERGGWWVDTDVICLRPLLRRDDEAVFASEAVWRQPGHAKVTNTIMGLPAGHPVARRCYEVASASDRTLLAWGELGPDLLHATVASHGCFDAVKPPNVFCPVAPWEWQVLLAPDISHCLSRIEPGTLTVHLWNELWRRAGMAASPVFPESCFLAQVGRMGPFAPGARM